MNSTINCWRQNHQFYILSLAFHLHYLQPQSKEDKYLKYLSMIKRIFEVVKNLNLNIAHKKLSYLLESAKVSMGCPANFSILNLQRVIINIILRFFPFVYHYERNENVLLFCCIGIKRRVSIIWESQYTNISYWHVWTTVC